MAISLLRRDILRIRDAMPNIISVDAPKADIVPGSVMTVATPAEYWASMENDDEYNHYQSAVVP